MTALQAVVMAILQGVTELFPISSLGHAVIVPAVLHWRIDENAEGFLPFLAVMHLGTSIALLGYFWRDWLGFAVSVIRFRDPSGAADRRLFWRVVVATIPAVVVGFLFEKALRQGFAAPTLAAVLLIANGAMLIAAERYRKPASRPLTALSWIDALVIGAFQCLALLPGLSRSGATMAGGYLRGLTHEEAARFSFLTATPIILGATVLEAPKLLHQGAGAFGPLSLLAGVVAGVTALISVILLMRWFRAHEVKGFQPFALYCAIAGLGAIIALNFR
jgi:undecaprenyl-diphosphatase